MTTAPLPVRALSIHAGYRCRHTGVCCSAGWDIAVESAADAGLRGRLAAGELAPPSPSRVEDLLVADSRLPPGYASRLGRDTHGRCLFLEHAEGNLCAIHRQCGIDALPSECRHFPRVSVMTPGSIDVSLSHFCPTAAEMLFREDVLLEITVNPPGMPPALVSSGLDARDALPPRLRPDALMTWESHRMWEEHCVATFAREGLTPEQALGQLSGGAEALRQWHPEGEGLDEMMLRIRRGALNAASAAPLTGENRIGRLADRVVSCVPPHLDAGVDWESVENPDLRDWGPWGDPVRRYLATRSFGNWVAQRGGGVRSAVASVALTLEILGREAARMSREGGGMPLSQWALTEAFRRTDLLLIHLCDPGSLADLCSEVEGWILPGESPSKGA